MVSDVKKFFGGLTVCACLASSGVATCGDNAKASSLGTFQTDFSDNGISIPGFKFDKSAWRVHGGALESIGGMNASRSFVFGEADWQDYDVELQLRRLNPGPKDQHFSLFVRCDGMAGMASGLRLYSRGDSVLFIELAGKRENRHALLASLPKPMGAGPDAPWTNFRVSVKGSQAKVYADNQLVGDIPDLLPISGKAYVYAYNLDLQIRKLSVTVNKLAPAGAAGTAVSRNILRNSSLEQCTLDRLPDYWGCAHWGIVEPYWVTHYGEWVKYYGVDDAEAYDGKRSMRIENPFDKGNSQSLCLRSCCLSTKVNQKYVFSAYMKSAPAGMEVSFCGKKVKLSGEWKRYDATFVNNGKSLYNDMLNIFPLGKGTFWIDAMQLEEGTELTAYSRSMFENQALQTQEGNQEKAISEVPTLEPRRVKGELKIDGSLTDPAWAAAETLALNTSTGAAAKQRAEAKVCYGDKGIYIGVKCMDEKAGEAVCKLLKRDDCVWNDPAIELFIDPNLTRNYYYHLAFNQKGVQYDSMCGDVSWNGQWKVATATAPDGKSWSAEVFLPFGELGINRGTGEMWGLNICRDDHFAKEACCWSPTYGSYHTPEKFGQIKIDKGLLASYCFDNGESALKRNGGDSCSLSTRIVNNSGKSGEFILKATLTDAQGREAGSFEKAVGLGDAEGKTVEFADALRNPEAKYGLNVQLLSKDGKSLLLSKSGFVEPPPLFHMIANFDLYTVESEMLLRLQTALDGKSLDAAKVELSVCDSKGLNVLKKDVSGLKAVTEAKLPIQELACGSYQVKAALKGAGGKSLASCVRDFRKLPPKGHEVKIDRLSRITLVDGKPFMPLGMAWEGPLTDEVFEYLAKSGCNAVSAFPSEKEMKDTLDSAAKYGIMFKIAFDARDKEKAERVIKAFRDHPALLGWDIFDEVFTGQWGRDNYELVKTRSVELKELDPYHPVYINENQYGLTYLRMKNLEFPGDIVSIDYYAWTPSGNFQVTGDYMRMMSEMGAADGRPCWIYLLGAGYAFWASRDYTPAEHEFSAYTSLINGGTGIFYFASHPKSESSWIRIKRILKEMDGLTPVVASQEAAPAVKCAAPSIQIMVKRYAGKTYLITVNSSKEPVSARFDLSGLNVKAADAMFEDRRLNVRDGVLEDGFEGFQRHVYVLEGKSDGWLMSIVDSLLP